MGTWNAKLWTLAIGLLAGSAPFLCMSYMPHLLDPSSTVREPDYRALAIIAVVVALVTMIQHARRFSDENPAEILMRSLAIPSILLATVTGLQSTLAISQQRAEASVIVDSTGTDVPIVPEAEPLLEVGPSPAKAAASWLWSPGDAWAQPVPTADDARRVALAKPAVVATQYLVTLGSYVNADEAEKDARGWSRTRALATERYYQKSVRVFRTAGERTVYVAHSAPLPRAEAVRLYKLLRINDPGVTPQVVQLASLPVEPSRTGPR